jgi:class 3 adenylate cyclase
MMRNVYLSIAVQFITRFRLVLILIFLSIYCFGSFTESDSLTIISDGKYTDSGQLTASLSPVNMIKSGPSEMVMPESPMYLKQKELDKQKVINYLILSISVFLILMLAGILNRYVYIHKTKNQLSEKNHIISQEKQKIDDLLNNILPEEIAIELKQNGHVKPRRHEKVTVMFTDFKDFSGISETMDTEDLISEIDFCYKAFDNIISKYDIEKIKTMGDAYIAVGGLPAPSDTHPSDVIDAALEIRQFMINYQSSRIETGKPFFEIRIGIHTGPVVSGVVGHKKFAFDIWGDTVNIAYCVQTCGAAGRVNISKTTMEMVPDLYDFTHRGKIPIKGERKVDMYFVNHKL